MEPDFVEHGCPVVMCDVISDVDVLGDVHFLIRVTTETDKFMFNYFLVVTLVVACTFVGPWTPVSSVEWSVIFVYTYWRSNTQVLFWAY